MDESAFKLMPRLWIQIEEKKPLEKRRCRALKVDPTFEKESVVLK